VPDAKWTRWYTSPAKEDSGAFSPDGRFVAFSSDPSGRDEVYVAPFEGGPEAQRWQVSAGGGVEPRWSADGKRLYYRTESYELMSVPVSISGGRIELGTASRHFQFPMGIGGYHRMTYSLTPDGTGVVTILRPESDASIHVRTGWN
jgi:Tol biopolymer transport system component